MVYSPVSCSDKTKVGKLALGHFGMGGGGAPNHRNKYIDYKCGVIGY